MGHSFEVGDRVKILRKDIYNFKNHKSKSGRIMSIDGDYILVKPFHCKWEIELYPNEIKLLSRPKKSIETIPAPTPKPRAEFYSGLKTELLFHLHKANELLKIKLKEDQIIERKYPELKLNKGVHSNDKKQTVKIIRTIGEFTEEVFENW